MRQTIFKILLLDRVLVEDGLEDAPDALAKLEAMQASVY